MCVCMYVVNQPVPNSLRHPNHLHLEQKNEKKSHHHHQHHNRHTYEIIRQHNHHQICDFRAGKKNIWNAGNKFVMMRDLWDDVDDDDVDDDVVMWWRGKEKW